jgi:TonB family protein
MMKRIIPATMLLGAVPALAGAEDAALAPAGSWQIDYAETHCTLSMNFAAGAQTVSLGLIPMSGANQVKVALIANDRSVLRGEGEARIVVSPASTANETYMYYAFAGPNERSTAMVKWTRTRMAELAGAKAMTVKLRNRDIAFQIKGVTKALDALAVCERDLIKGWGFDPEPVASSPRLLNPLEVVNPRDYPLRALEEGRGGETGFRLRIDVQGKPVECAITEKSGNNDLDASVCALVMKRARFSPAAGKDGKPIEGLFATAIVWLNRGGR